MIRTIDIGFTKFSSSNREALEEYYQSVLGLKKIGVDGKKSYFGSRSGAPALTLSSGHHPVLDGVVFKIDNEDESGDVIAMLQAHGIAAEQRSDPYPEVANSIAFVDPSGLEIELVKQLPPAPPSSPLGVAALRLGHVSVLTPDVVQISRFYSEVLGFKVGDWVGDFFVFMRCNHQHHTINFIKSETTRMHHVAFEMQHTSALISSCDVLAKQSYPLLWGPVRHGPGHNIATYHKNPVGQIIELFTEMDMMTSEHAGYYDPRPWQTDQPQVPKVWSTTGPRRDVWGPMPPQGFLADGV